MTDRLPSCSPSTRTVVPPPRSLIATVRGGWFVQPSLTSILDLDFNVRSSRSNVVLRSEWRLGSTLFLVWQQNRSGRDAIGSVVQAADLIDALRAQGTISQ